MAPTPKTNLLTVRLTDEQREALDRLSESEDVPIAQLVRRAISELIERQRPKRPKKR
jgi:predicted transcriptional regulator